MIGLIKGTARQAKTVSGLPLPIASYKSNSKAPIQELSLSINPTQSGSGDPYPAGGGKNKFDKSEFQNLRTNYEYVDESYYCRSIQLLPNTTYTVSQNAGSTSSVIILINVTSHVNEAGYFDLRKASDVKTFTTDNSGKLYIGVYIYTSDTQYNERLEQCKVQIEAGSSATDYAPYSNIRPITGVSNVNVTRTGKNLSPTQPINYTATNYGVILFWVKAGTYTASYTGGNCQFYVRTSTPTDTTITSGTEISHSTTYRNDYTFTVPSDGYYKVQLYRSSGSPWSAVDAPTNFQIEIGNQPTTYEPYTGDTYTIALGNTYYGATLDVDENGNVKLRLKYVKSVVSKTFLKNYSSGDMTFHNDGRFSLRNLFYGSDKGAFGNYYNRQRREGGFYCKSNVFNVLQFNDSHYMSTQYRTVMTLPNGVTDYASWQTFMQNLIDNDVEVHFVYEFTQGSPVEFDLTPTQINSLLGSNNIWHDGNGDVEVLKFMDRQLYFGR